MGQADEPIERFANCPKHGRVLIALERPKGSPESWGWHSKVGGRWCRFRVRSWIVRAAPR